MKVSWIRKRDLHILTAGVLTYTSDQRFQVIRPDRSENWTLLIKFPQERDSGIYECQVNTEPKMSLAFRLSVIGTTEEELWDFQGGKRKHTGGTTEEELWDFQGGKRNDTNIREEPPRRNSGTSKEVNETTPTYGRNHRGGTLGLPRRKTKRHQHTGGTTEEELWDFQGGKRLKHGDAAHQHEEDTPRYDAAEEQDGHAAAQEQNGQVVAQEQDGHVAAHEHDGHVAAHEQDGHVATHEQDGHVVAHERDRHVTAYEQEAHVTDSCSTLSNTLAQLQEQLNNIQKQLKGLQKSITPQEIKTASAQIPNVTQGKNINIFIVGDSHVRDLKTIMESKLPKNLSVDHSFIPGGRFHDISSKCIKKYENCDHLIVMAGTNDIGKTSFKEIKTHIENIIIKFKDSKIHLVLVPDRFDKVTMNLDIKILNDKIKTLVKDYKNITIYHTTSIVDSWDYCDNIHFGPNEPKARILGAQDLYVKIDSSITLICEISQGPHSLGTVQWYKGLTPITSSPPRVTVDASWSEGLSSRLHISHVIAEDSGNYSCVPTTRVQSDSVYIHVINGEHPAAMQHGNRCTVSKISFLTVISALGVYYFLNTMYHIR
ncbi:hypothetical protein M8J76_008767 [Diaphorina citri]|nr:hypothetical protein M8J76_008767 [Diaphorina citri]